MTAASDPALQRLLLRRALRAAREHAGHTQAQAAEAMGWSESKLLRIESGQFGINTNDLLALLELYKVTDDELIALLRRYATGSRTDPWARYRDVLKPEYRAYLALEGIAERIRHYHPLLIPGLLQTPDYATRTIDVFAAAGTDVQVRNLQHEARMLRQAVLSKPDPPAAHFILDEAALRRIAAPGALDAIHRGQLQHLADVSRRPGVTIQILPFDRGLHAGLGGPFTLLNLPAGAPDGDYVYIEQTRATSALREAPADITRYSGIFTNLAGLAAGPEDTAALLDELLAQ